MAIQTTIWLLLYGLWESLPQVRPGFARIYDAKIEHVATGQVFADDDRLHFVLFGNSQVLAGFKPDLFDALTDGRVSSYNLGLPDSGRFINEIEALVARGQKPSHVLLTLPWSGENDITMLESLLHDKIMISTLFPFRHLVRDTLQFYVRSRSYGGLSAFSDYSARQVEKALIDRGYFFVEAMSHYPGHRLPDDFKTESQTPDETWVRNCDHRGPVFERLVALARRENIRLIMVPTYFREGQFAPAGSNQATRSALAADGIEVVGPDYWLYPNRLFSDPTHLNIEGAEVHTRQLFELLEPIILSDSSAGST